MTTKNPMTINDVERDSIDTRKKQTEDDIEREQNIRYGRYVVAWQLLPVRMSVALVVEIVVGFLAILTSSGSFQILPSIVSFLYLIYIFSSSKTGNTIRVLKEMYNDFREGDIEKIINIIFFWIPILLPACIVLDLVQVDFDCVSPQTLSFAAADMVIIIASINYASRAPALSTSIPLLVSFDFITKFSTQIISSVSISDDDAIKKADDNGAWINKKLFLRVWLPIIVMVGVIVAAIVLACLSIGIDSYVPIN